jgi:hypothetical protein
MLVLLVAVVLVEQVVTLPYQVVIMLLILDLVVQESLLP